MVVYSCHIGDCGLSVYQLVQYRQNFCSDHSRENMRNSADSFYSISGRAIKFRQHARQTCSDSGLELWLSATEQIAQEALDKGSILRSVHNYCVNEDRLSD